MELDFSKQIGESEKLKRMLAEQKSSKDINNLPDSDFAYISPGGKKDEQGKTVPRSLRHLPIMDCAHVRNALARLSQTKIPASAKASALKKIKAAAKKCDIKVSESDSKDWEKIDEDEGMALGAERYDGKKRSELEDSAFLDPKRRSFPVVSCKNVRAAVSTWGMYKGPMSFDEFKRKLTARAKKLGCESSLPKTWKDESSAKDWEKIDTKELKRDNKKEKKEHHKDAVEDDEDKIKKLKKGKPSEKKSVEVHDLKKDIEYDKKKEAQAMSDKQKAARDKFMEMIKKKKKGGDEDEKEDDDKDKKKKDDKKESKAVDYNVWQPVQNLDIEKEKAPETKDFGRVQPFLEQKAETDKEQHKDLEKREEKQDKGEMDSETVREKIKHHEDALKNLRKEIKDLEKDKKEDKGDVEKELEESRAPMGCPECY